MAQRPPSPEETAAESVRRRSRFHDDYGSSGSAEADTLRECLIASHRFVAEIVGGEVADAGFDAMIAEFFVDDVRALGWREALLENDGMLYSELPAGQLFHDLHAYACDGIALMGTSSSEARRGFIVRMLDRAEKLVARIPFELWGIDDGDLGRTMLLAKGRWALDNGEPIEARALAIFGGVTERRIRNMISKTEGLLPNDNGRIPAREALDWLRLRPATFRPSVWKEQDAFEDLVRDDEPPLERVFFVPVGQDGSVFHPGLARDGIFRIGAGADDIVVEGFESALERLQRMILPVWRRPTAQDHWTRVQGVRWERMTLNDLERRAT